MSTETTAPTAATRRLIPASKWGEFHSYPPPGTIRSLIFHSKENGFDRCIRRLGRRILIDEAAYFEWLDGQNGATHG